MLSNALSGMVLGQRKRKLESMENEDDLDTVMKKLIDEAAISNIQRCQCVIEIKVKLPYNFKFWHCNTCSFEEFSRFFFLIFSLFLQNLLIEAVSYKRTFAEKHMTSIEFDAKVYAQFYLSMLV